jgi:hypothetical protein
MTNEATDQIRLGSLLRTRGQLDADVVVELGIRLAEALAGAERAGVGSSPLGGRVPLTPDSFVLLRDGSVFLRPGRGLGKDGRPGFRTWAAPEQLRGEPGGMPAWMFSVGAILYEAATGDTLFEAASPPAVNNLVLDDLDGHLMMVALKGRLKAVRPGLEALAKSCLSVDPKRRPDSPAIFRVLLEELVSDTPSDSLAAVTIDAIDQIEAAQSATRSQSAGDQNALETLPDADEPLASASAEDFWNNFGTPPASADPPPFASDGHPGDDFDAFAPDPENGGGEGIGGQSLEVGLDPRPTAAEPPRPTPAAADVARPGDTGEVSVADRSIDQSFTDEAMRTARVRPIREIPPAVTTGFRRLAKLVGGLLALVLLLFLVLWLQLMPGLPAGLTDPLETGIAPLAEPLPEGLRGWAANTWETRSSGERAGRFWNKFVDVLPSEIQRSLRPPAALEAHIDWPGTPRGEGLIDVVSPALAAEPGLPESSGRLELALAYQGSARPLGGPITWTAEPVDDPRGAELARDIARIEGTVAVSTAKDRTTKTGEGHDPFLLPAGFWDVAIVYGESELAGGWEAAVNGVRVSPGYKTVLVAGVNVPAGRITPRVLLDGQEQTEHLTVALFTAESAATVQRAEKEAALAAIETGDEPRQTTMPPAIEEAAPLWVGPIADVPALNEGKITVRVAYDDTVHWPSVSWFEGIEVHGMMTTNSPTWKLEKDEPLNPTGPGVRIAATNFGTDISRQTQVFLYRAEDDVLHAAAIASGRAGRYLDVSPGEYNLRLVYQPMGPKSTLFGEKVMASFEVATDGVTETAIDLEFPMAWLDLQVTDRGEDVSTEVDLVVLREGVARDAGTRTLDEEGVGQHVLPADTYDIYVVYKPTDGRDVIDAVFSSVKLEAGQRWVQEWNTAKLPWSAERPR